MKIILPFILIAFLSPLYTLGQVPPMAAPLNPEFSKHQDNQPGDTFTDDGFPLGENPTPALKYFDPDYSPDIDVNNLPSAYDLRFVNDGKWLSPVRNQGREGSCWAFATYGAIESYWLKNGLGKEDLSEQNLATCHGFDWSPSDGGNYDLSMAYLSRLSGPIYESDDPYTLPDNPDCVEGLIPMSYVNEARYLPGIDRDNFDPAIIKQALIDNGALYVNMWFESEYMNYQDNTYYYNDTEGTNHAVLLVGWDDNKVITGNRVSPSSPGAWIIRNSWGPTWGETGYFYISYEDTEALSYIAYFPGRMEYIRDSKVYGYDDLGWCNSFGWNDGDDYALVKFTATKDQILESVGSFVTSGNSEVDISVYRSFDGTNLSNRLGSIRGQYCEYPGYYNFEFSNDINLQSGRDFYVLLRYYNSSAYPIPVEQAIEDYSSMATIETEKCWISNNADYWFALGGDTGYDIDVSVKAYARDVISTAPIAEFSAWPERVGIGEEVRFRDLSTGVPNEWTWSFEGADMINSNEKNPSASWSVAGTYDVTLLAENDLGGNTEVKADYITVVNGPLTCQEMSNIGQDDNIISSRTANGYLSGHNSYDWSQFAERYENPSLNSLTQINLGVEKAEALSSNPIITIKVWEENNGLPGAEIYREEKYIFNFWEGTTNTIFLSEPLVVPEKFFVGYEISYDTPQDTFALDIVEDRGNASPYNPSIFVFDANGWSMLDDYFPDGFNSSLMIELELCPAPPVTGFSADQTEACGSLNVQFTDESLCNPDNWFWDFGDGSSSTEQNPSHQYSSPGVYTVSLMTSNTLGDDIQLAINLIEVFENPDLDLGDDVELCPGDSATLDAGAGMSSYSWSSGENTQRLVVSDAGTYGVTITDSNGCSATDLLEISLLQAPSVDLGENIEACDTETPIVLDAGPGQTSYTWSPSGNGQILEVNDSGSYSVLVENSDGCTATDEINISILPAPNPDFGLERIEVCEDETPIVLDPNVAEDYYFLWSTGEDTETITVDNSTTYYVTVSYGACSAEDEVTLLVQSLPMAFDVLGGGQIDPGSESEILLSGSEQGVRYILFHDMQGEVARVAGTGDQVSFGKFSEPGIYRAEAITDVANCQADMNGSVEIILTNINPAIAGQIRLYPNPVSHILTIDTQVPIDRAKIYNSSGKTMADYETNPEEINFSQRADGVYFIELQTAQGTYRQRIVKTE